MPLFIAFGFFADTLDLEVTWDDSSEEVSDEKVRVSGACSYLVVIDTFYGIVAILYFSYFFIDSATECVML